MGCENKFIFNPLTDWRLATTRIAASMVYIILSLKLYITYYQHIKGLNLALFFGWVIYGVVEIILELVFLEKETNPTAADALFIAYIVMVTA